MIITILCLFMILVGGALIETPIIGFINGECGIIPVIVGVIFGGFFIVPAVLLFIYNRKDSEKKHWELDMADVLAALKLGFKETEESNYLDRTLISFREHYSEFLSKKHISENEKIQKDVTQIFRNILQLQKERLNRLGLTCEMMIKRMNYTKKDGIITKFYSDGKYKITDVEEQVAAQTIYKKDNEVIYKKIDRDTANYTIIQAQKVGDEKIICPNCGVETTREALLDGCDFCGTKFLVEDLGSRIAVVAFRPSFKLRYEKYKKVRNHTIILSIIGIVCAVYLVFTVYAVIKSPEMFDYSGGGIILTALASIFAILVASPVYILSFLIVYAKYIIPVILIGIVVSRFISKSVHKVKDEPMLDRAYEEKIRKADPNFSIANFYSGVQNKIAAIIYAENKEQIQAFSDTDLTGLLGKYADVVGIDVSRMYITNYSTVDNLQYIDVDTVLLLTRYRNNKCVVKKERVKLKLVKSLSCKTQVVCAPIVRTCKNCGTSLDIFKGKKCSFCKTELKLKDYDWMINQYN